MIQWLVDNHLEVLRPEVSASRLDDAMVDVTMTR